MENATITPWNWDSVIDKSRSAENFIKRMTGICTYLQGEDVLPKCSLLYEEFCVLNELNGVRWTEDGDYEQRLDEEQRRGIVEDLFHRYRTVSYERIANWLVENGYASSAHVVGGQGVSGLESKMSSYIFFAKRTCSKREDRAVRLPYESRRSFSGTRCSRTAASCVRSCRRSMGAEARVALTMRRSMRFVKSVSPDGAVCLRSSSRA